LVVSFPLATQKSYSRMKTPRNLYSLYLLGKMMDLFVHSLLNLSIAEVAVAVLRTEALQCLEAKLKFFFRNWEAVNKFFTTDLPKLARENYAESILKKTFSCLPTEELAKCLRPEARVQDDALKLLTVLCTSLPTVPDKDVSSITDEWKVYRVEEITNPEIYFLKNRFANRSEPTAITAALKNSPKFNYKHLKKFKCWTSWRHNSLLKISQTTDYFWQRNKRELTFHYKHLYHSL
ncbi:hypothetical protein DPMN_141675, partial [Dreissena polymorpha]